MLHKLCVNILGSPSSGKTVAATKLFANLKSRHINCVYVPEYATEKAIEGNQTIFQNQLVVWATQQYRIFCAYNHSPITITDSPILLGAIYNAENPSLCSVIMTEHQKYNNLNIVMELDENYPYSMVGRVHSLTESMGIQQQIINLLEMNKIPYLLYNETTEEEIVDLIVDSIS